MMQRPESDPYRPYIMSVRGLLSKPLGCDEDAVRDSPTSAVDVDGDVVAVVIGFDLRLDIALVDLITEACGLLGGAPEGCHCGLPVCVWVGSDSTVTSMPPTLTASSHYTTPEGMKRISMVLDRAPVRQ